MKAQTNYFEWEGKVTDEIERLCNVTRSDAQSIVEAKEFTLCQSWGKGMSAEATAKLIEENSRVNATT